NKVNKVNKRYAKTPVQKNNTHIINKARQLMTSDITKAIDLLELNLTKITPAPDYYALLANLYLRKQRYNDAILFYQRALKQEQDRGEFWIGLALSYRGKGEIKNSKKAFKQASNSTNISSQLKLYAKQQHTK
ncbi:MAG: tetratricopeptide repeat protein, partial [Thiotrichaceae bacterium]|nr:tetratricopeptide repeat protein [Thiotrichaceae bacterium]